MIRTGRVIHKEHNLLQVCFDKEEACTNCGLCGRQESTMSVQGEAQVGDVIEVELPDAQVLKASMITYALPLVGLILGLWLGTELFPGREGLSLLIGAVGTVLFFGGVKLFDSRLRKTSAWQPRIIAIHPVEADLAEEAIPTK